MFSSQKGAGRKLPPPDTEWSEGDRLKWLETIATIFDLVFKGNWGGFIISPARSERSPRSGDHNSEAALGEVMARQLIGAAIAFLPLSATLALSDEPQRIVRLEELWALGAIEMANGSLIQEIAATCYPMLVLGDRTIGAGRDCLEPRVTYGSFKRLTLDGVEFVCISFRAWQCYESK